MTKLKDILVFDGSYYRVYLPEYPNADTKGYVRLHRLVTEAILGRQLLDGETIHHIDGNSLNNCPTNLQILSNSEHIKLHWKEGSFSKNCQKREKPITCAICGELKEHASKGLCSRCYGRERYRSKQMELGKEVNYKDMKLNHDGAVCSVCKKEVPLWAKKMCNRCYKRVSYRKKNDLPLYTPPHSMNPKKSNG